MPLKDWRVFIRSVMVSGRDRTQVARSRFKPYLRWVIVGGTLFFLLTVLHQHWQQVTEIEVNGTGWALLAVGLGMTLLAHTCAGWVWGRTLQEFRQPVQPGWAIPTYLRTNLAKYLPGNVWHYYGRITAATDAGATLGAATVSVLLEPLLMAAAALMIAILGIQPIAMKYGLSTVAVQWLSLLMILLALHPRVLNPIIGHLSQLKQKASGHLSAEPGFRLSHYPLVPLAGQFGFLLLRAVGFGFTLLAVSSISLHQIPLLLSGFSLAWLLGLVVPGAPGGIGVFEATAIALLGQSFSVGIVLAAVALYRVVSILAELAGAGLAWLDQRW